MKKIKSFGITGRFSNKTAVKAAKQAIRIFEKKAVPFWVDEKFPVAKKKLKKLGEMSVGAVLVFGGDGTLLRTVRALKKSIPVAGVNCGRLGFLMDISNNNVKRKLLEILQGKYWLEKRTRVKAVVDGKRLSPALNEVTIAPEMGGRLIHYLLEFDGSAREEASDGLIVATPTGSTGHSLSAGGPIIKSKAQVLVINSINPIDWTNRPLVIDDHAVIKVTRTAKEQIEVIIDGQERFPMEKEAIIKKGKTIQLLRLSD
jgi:NAD+ kinase